MALTAPQRALIYALAAVTETAISGAALQAIAGFEDTQTGGQVHDLTNMREALLCALQHENRLSERAETSALQACLDLVDRIVNGPTVAGHARRLAQQPTKPASGARPTLSSFQRPVVRLRPDGDDAA